MIKGGSNKSISLSNRFRIPYYRPTKNYDGKNYFFPSKDNDTSALLARMTNVGRGYEYAIENLIIGIKKDHGIKQLSDLFDGLWVFAADSTTNANLNWVSSSFTATVGANTFSGQYGYTLNASSINTNWSPGSAVNYTEYSASFGLYITKTVNQNGAQTYLTWNNGTNQAGIFTIATGGNPHFTSSFNSPTSNGGLNTFNYTKAHGLVSLQRYATPPFGTTTGNTFTYNTCVNGQPVQVYTDSPIAIGGANTLATGSNLVDSIGAIFVGSGLINQASLARRLNEYFLRVGGISNYVG
jgi:hypothetical protein